MVSMYASEQQRLRAYRKDRKLKEELEEQQQERLDEILDKQNGVDDSDTLWKTSMPDALKKLTKGVKRAKTGGASILLNAINSGKLNELIKMVRSVDETDFKNAGVEGGFNRNMKSMRDRLNDEQERAVLNMLISEKVSSGPEAIAEAIVNYITDGKPELRNNFYKMLNMVEQNFDIEDFDEVSDISKANEKKKRERELEGMEMEDKRSRQIEDYIKEMKKLTAQEDLKLREKFLEVLDEMKSSTGEKNEVRLINSIIKLVEKQRMEDAFKKWSDFAMEEAFASKLQRNMKALMENKKIIREAKERTKERKREAMERAEMAKRDVDKQDDEEKKKGRPAIIPYVDIQNYKKLLKELGTTEKNEGNKKNRRNKRIANRRTEIRDEMRNIENRLKDSNNFYIIEDLYEEKKMLLSGKKIENKKT